MNRYSIFGFLRPKKFLEISIGDTVRIKPSAIKDMESYRQIWYSGQRGIVTAIEPIPNASEWILATVKWNGQDRPETFATGWLEVVNE